MIFGQTAGGGIWRLTVLIFLAGCALVSAQGPCHQSGCGPTLSGETRSKLSVTGEYIPVYNSVPSGGGYRVYQPDGTLAQAPPGVSVSDNGDIAVTTLSGVGVAQRTLDTSSSSSSTPLAGYSFKWLTSGTSPGGGVTHGRWTVRSACGAAVSKSLGAVLHACEGGVCAYDTATGARKSMFGITAVDWPLERPGTASTRRRAASLFPTAGAGSDESARTVAAAVRRRAFAAAGSDQVTGPLLAPDFASVVGITVLQDGSRAVITFATGAFGGSDGNVDDDATPPTLRGIHVAVVDFSGATPALLVSGTRALELSMASPEGVGAKEAVTLSPWSTPAACVGESCCLSGPGTGGELLCFSAGSGQSGHGGTPTSTSTMMLNAVSGADGGPLISDASGHPAALGADEENSSSSSTSASTAALPSFLVPLRRGALAHVQVEFGSVASAHQGNVVWIAHLPLPGQSVSTKGGRNAPPPNKKATTATTTRADGVVAFAGTPIGISPAVTAFTNDGAAAVALVAAAGALHCLSGADGTVHWSRVIGPTAGTGTWRIAPMTVTSAGQVIVASGGHTGDGEWISLDLATGKIIGSLPDVAAKGSTPTGHLGEVPLPSAPVLVSSTGPAIVFYHAPDSGAIVLSMFDPRSIPLDVTPGHVTALGLAAETVTTGASKEPEPSPSASSLDSNGAKDNKAGTGTGTTTGAVTRAPETPRANVSVVLSLHDTWDTSEHAVDKFLLSVVMNCTLGERPERVPAETPPKKTEAVSRKAFALGQERDSIFIDSDSGSGSEPEAFFWNPQVLTVEAAEGRYATVEGVPLGDSICVRARVADVHGRVSSPGPMSVINTAHFGGGGSAGLSTPVIVLISIIVLLVLTLSVYAIIRIRRRCSRGRRWSLLPTWATIGAGNKGGGDDGDDVDIVQMEMSTPMPQLRAGVGVSIAPDDAQAGSSDVDVISDSLQSSSDGF